MSARNPPQGPPPPRFMGDLAHLEPHGHSHRSLTWWGMMGLVAIEGTVFVLACAAYLYYANQTPHWPPEASPPAHVWGTVFTVITLLSIIPNMWANQVAEKELPGPVRISLVLMSLIGLALLVIRYLEFAKLNVSWDQSAYSSVVLLLLALHTVHLATDWVDTVVLTCLMFTRHGHGRRFVDCAENAIYWNFVVLAWPPIYALVYWAPRWL